LEDDPQPGFRIATDDELRRHDEDIRDLRRVQDELREDWSSLTDLTPHDLVRAWIAIVAIVDVGYDGEWEEYTNDLMTREFIAELSRRLPGRWAGFLPSGSRFGTSASGPRPRKNRSRICGRLTTRRSRAGGGIAPRASGPARISLGRHSGTLAQPTEHALSVRLGDPERRQ
jgi:hypothetical protein